MPRIALALLFLCIAAPTSLQSQDDAQQKRRLDEYEGHKAFEQAQSACIAEGKELRTQARAEKDEVVRKQLYRKMCEISVKHYLPLARRYPTCEAGIRFLCRCVSVNKEAIELLKKHPANIVANKFINEASNNMFFEYDYVVVMNAGFEEVVKAKATLGLAFSYRLKALAVGQPTHNFDASDRVCDDGMHVCRTLIKNYADVVIYFNEITLAGGIPRHFHQAIPIKELAEVLNYEFEHLRIGHPMPAFSAVDLEGKSLKLADYQGKLVLIDFFSKEHSYFERFSTEREQLAAKLAGKPVVFLGVHVKTTEGMVDVNASIKPWRLMKDQSTPDHPAFSQHWAIFTLPTTYFIDHKGILQSKLYAQIPLEHMEKSMEYLLKEIK